MAEMDEAKIYEVMIPLWRGQVLESWQWEVSIALLTRPEWQTVAGILTICAGDKLRARSEEGAAVLATMAEHGYLKAVDSNQ